MDLRLLAPSTTTTTCSSSSSSNSMLSLPLCSCSDSTFSPSWSGLPLDTLCLRTRSVLPIRHQQHKIPPSRRSKTTSWKWTCSALMENALPAKQDFYTVGDFMTQLDDLLVVKTSTTVDEALELLVQNRVTGLPVVDEAGKLIGVVSDFDLLALDTISGAGKRSSDSALFPEANSTWKAFKELQKLLSKTQGKTVGEVMTPSPLVVREQTNLEDAARLLLETKYRRLPVVDDNGKLLGLLTRGNVIRAALKMKRDIENLEG